MKPRSGSFGLFVLSFMAGDVITLALQALIPALVNPVYCVTVPLILFVIVSLATSSDRNTWEVSKEFRIALAGVIAATLFILYVLPAVMRLLPK